MSSETPAHIKEAVDKAIEGIADAITRDGGRIAFSGFDAQDGTVRVRLEGACASCAMSALTLKLGLERPLLALGIGIARVVREGPRPSL
jgi:Fe-S cluster biogenesis protein NfuA